jgi:hypothetical protein
MNAWPDPSIERMSFSKLRLLQPPLMSNVRPPQSHTPMNLLKVAIASLALVIVAGCDFQKEADAKFGDQHFKTVIALVELHKVRTGNYPAKLEDIQFTGDWDAIAISSVEYKKLEVGYEVNVTRGLVAKPEIAYPKEFWQGLGLARSNLKAGT